MHSLSLWFEGREKIDIREDELPDPGPGEVQVQTLVSAISPGTEMLFYRGELQEGMQVDTALEGFAPRLCYPLRYGYACAGVVRKAGAGVDPGLEGSLVFSFSPHASGFVVPADQVVRAPAGTCPEDAVFLATMETAVTLVLDGRPGLGDKVSVFGLGIVGLSVTGLLSRFPLARLSGYDMHPLRREAAAALGARTADPRTDPPARLTEDIAFEISGSPRGFGQAILSCAFTGLVVIGSWYGSTAPPWSMNGTGAHETAAINAALHRNRLRVVTSQVSSIDPSLGGRWDRARRFEEAWRAIASIAPARWVTHRIPFDRAADAYRLIAGKPQETIQVLLTYS